MIPLDSQLYKHHNSYLKEFHVTFFCNINRHYMREWDAIFRYSSLVTLNHLTFHNNVYTLKYMCVQLLKCSSTVNICKFELEAYLTQLWAGYLYQKVSFCCHSHRHWPYCKNCQYCFTWCSPICALLPLIFIVFYSINNLLKGILFSYEWHKLSGVSNYALPGVM